jgi:hypothetical protein
MKNRLNGRCKQAYALMFSILRILSILYEKLAQFNLNYLTIERGNLREKFPRNFA